MCGLKEPTLEARLAQCTTSAILLNPSPYTFPTYLPPPATMFSTQGGDRVGLYGPPSSDVLGAGPSAALGVTRSRTLLFLSIRDSLAPSSGSASAPLLGDDDYGRDKGPFDSAAGDSIALFMPEPVLPPQWVDATEEVDACLSQLIPKLAQLDRLHSQHLLPSFADKSVQEREIEALTGEVTLVCIERFMLRPGLSSCVTAYCAAGEKYNTSDT